MRLIPVCKEPKKISLKAFLKKRPQMALFFKRLPVKLVFLHGSLAQDRLKPLSDIDIAILAKEKGYSFRRHSKIYEKLCNIIGREDVDVGVINRASPVYAMQVLTKGIPIFVRDEKYLKEFRYQTMQRYLSTKFLRLLFQHYVYQAIVGDNR